MLVFMPCGGQQSIWAYGYSFASFAAILANIS